MHPPRNRVRNSHYFGNIILYIVYMKKVLVDDILFHIFLYLCLEETVMNIYNKSRSQ